MRQNFYNDPIDTHLIDDDLDYNPLIVKPFDPTDCLTEEQFNEQVKTRKDAIRQAEATLEMLD